MSHLAIGLNSGTAADGISAVLCSFSDRQFKFLGEVQSSYPVEILTKVKKGGNLSVQEVSRLDLELGYLFAKSVRQLLKKTRTPKEKVFCIGSHGQTIYHGFQDDVSNTMQIANPAVIAHETGIPVVSQFRQGDIAAGGEGAPLIPFFDQYFYGNDKVRAMVNIGGISNVTIVGKGFKEPPAFDIGPGNGLMDRALYLHSNGKQCFDNHGRLAKKGKMNMALISLIMEWPYFKKEPPKSTGSEMFGDEFLAEYFPDGFSPIENTLATLNYLTCISIQEAFRSFVFPQHQIDEIIVSGGGVYNKTMMKKLACLFAPIPVVSIEDLDVPTLAKEPIAFAFYGVRAMQNKNNHLPHCTGAKTACVLGSITRP